MKEDAVLLLLLELYVNLLLLHFLNFTTELARNSLQLLDSCLKSPLLPAYLAAAFSKKLSRLALYVPPSGALVIIALIHNLLRRHPSINCLVQLVTMLVLFFALIVQVLFSMPK